MCRAAQQTQIYTVLMDCRQIPVCFGFSLIYSIFSRPPLSPLPQMRLQLSRAFRPSSPIHHTRISGYVPHCRSLVHSNIYFYFRFNSYFSCLQYWLAARWPMQAENRRCKLKMSRLGKMCENSVKGRACTAHTTTQNAQPTEARVRQRVIVVFICSWSIEKLN